AQRVPRQVGCRADFPRRSIVKDRPLKSWVPIYVRSISVFWIMPIKLRTVEHLIIIHEPLYRRVAGPVVIAVRAVVQSVSASVILFGVAKIPAEQGFVLDAVSGQ